MGRRYTVSFEKVSIAAAQDLLQINGASNKLLRILRQRFDAVDPTLPTSQFLQLRSRILPPTVTNGTGTSVATISKSPSDSDPSFTARSNNSTSQASTSGTAEIKFEGGMHIFTGHEWMYDDPPEIPSSSSFVFELLNAPAAAVLMSAMIEVEELG